jgi:flagellar biogenesis protein FliO
MMKKVTGALFIILVLIAMLTWHYRKPFLRSFGKKGFVMVYHVGDRPMLKAKYVIITRVKKRVIVEIIKGPGIENVVRLEGEEAKRFLREANLEYNGG